LPEDIRWTLLLCDVEGVEQSDAAQVLDVPTGTIKSRLHRGRAMLRVALEPLARDRGLLTTTARK
jgi:RNA polymerase sigma-70 factor (ECF subfamily)